MAEEPQFTKDWFTVHIPVWERVLVSHIALPNLRYLEVGVYEGRALLWMAKHILTHPTSHMTCLDTFPYDIEARLKKNIEVAGLAGRVTVLHGRSQELLRTLPVCSFDIIYVDGSHDASDVLSDIVLSFELLKVGGVLILDDYTMPEQIDVLHRPKNAIDAFLDVFCGYIDVLHKENQVMVKRVVLRYENGLVRLTGGKEIVGEVVLDEKQNVYVREGAKTIHTFALNDVRSVASLYPNKTIREERSYQHGKLHGAYRTYYKNGSVWSEVEYEHGVKQAIAFYDEEGKKF